jgi:hypothetical protein
MVGYCIGLGDRHCENILIDTLTGDVLHVDFDLLFDKGWGLAVPELMPFRLTPQVVDGFGALGLEGTFRAAAEHTMRALRDNKRMLITVLQVCVCAHCTCACRRRFCLILWSSGVHWNGVEQALVRHVTVGRPPVKW